MSTSLRKIIICVIGLLGGIAAWAMAEGMLMMQPEYPSYLAFSIALGGVFGATMGAFFGSIEGITLSIPARTKRGFVSGLLIGIVGGGIGFLAGQGALFLVEEFIFSNKMLHSFGIPVSRTIGWAFLGCFIGSIEGIRSSSVTKVVVGILGGTLGGLIGGAALEVLQVLKPNLMAARLAGLAILGTSIGLFYSLIEGSFARGVLKILNGSLKGKEYLLIQKKLTIGSGDKANIKLSHYDRVADLHADLKITGEGIRLESRNPTVPIKVNDKPIKDHFLKFQDVIQVGSAKFLFFYK